MLRHDRGRATRARKSADRITSGSRVCRFSSRITSSSTDSTVPSRLRSSCPLLNGPMKRRLYRICASPSVVSMWDPKMSLMFDAGESVVKRFQSARTRTMSSRRVSSHMSSSGAHVTGSAARNSWKTGYGSSASASMVKRAPRGYRWARSFSLSATIGSIWRTNRPKAPWQRLRGWSAPGCNSEAAPRCTPSRARRAGTPYTLRRTRRDPRTSVRPPR